MEYVFGIHAAGRSVTFVNLEAAQTNPKLRGHKDDLISADFWEDLDPGAIARDGSMDERQKEVKQKTEELEEKARCHDLPWRTLAKFLDRPLGEPHAMGMTVPYAVGPLAREIARRVFLEAWKKPSGDALTDRHERVALLETPLAMGLSAHARGEFGNQGFISPGCGCWEISVLRIRRGLLTVNAFREAVPGTELAVIEEIRQRLSVDLTPTQWFLPAPKEHPNHLPSIDRDDLLRRLGCDVCELKPYQIVEGVALYAWAMAQSENGGRNEFMPRISRLTPRSIGLMGTNSNGSWYWMRLVSAEAPGDKWTFTVKARTRPDDEPTLLLASLRDGVTEGGWLSVLQSADRLHWWHSELAPIRTSAISPNALELSINLTAVNDSRGFRIEKAEIESAAAGCQRGPESQFAK